MKIYTKLIQLETKKRFEIKDITKEVKTIISNSGVKEGFVNIFSKHTTLSIKINENEKLLLEDIQTFMNKIAPRNKKYNHNKIELRPECDSNEQKNADGHLKSLILETSAIIPLIKSNLCLGKWQNILAIETSGPRAREIAVQAIGE